MSLRPSAAVVLNACLVIPSLPSIAHGSEVVRGVTATREGDRVVLQWEPRDPADVETLVEVQCARSVGGDRAECRPADDLAPCALATGKSTEVALNTAHGDAFEEGVSYAFVVTPVDTQRSPSGPSTTTCLRMTHGDALDGQAAQAGQESAGVACSFSGVKTASRSPRGGIDAAFSLLAVVGAYVLRRRRGALPRF